MSKPVIRSGDGFGSGASDLEMFTSLSESALRITMAETADALLDALSDAIANLDFQNFHLTFSGPYHDVIVKGLGTPKGPQCVFTGLPPRDMVLTRLARRREREFVWALDSANDHMRSKYAAVVARYGISAGVSVPLYYARRHVVTLTAGIQSGTVSPEQAMSLAIIGRLALLQGITLTRPKLSSDSKLTPVQLLAQISPKQAEILKWVAEGKTNREIAVITQTRHRTIDYHIQEILKKLGVSTRAQAVAIYIAAAR